MTSCLVALYNAGSRNLSFNFLTYLCSFSPLGEEERGLDDGPRHLPVSLQPVVDQRRPRGGDDAARSVIISPS